MFEINKDITKAKTLHSDFYTDSSVFDKTKSSIFEKTWQFICSSNEVKPFSSYPFIYLENFLSENLIINYIDNEFKCFSNTCTHRGHMISECAHNNSVLQCRYHGRAFNLDGTLKHAPGFKKAINFPSENDHLQNIDIFNWNNFLFVSLNPFFDIKNVLSQIDEILPDFPYDKIVLEKQSPEYIIDCHWALYCENYLEGFHIPYVHKGLHSEIDYKNYETTILDEIVLQKVTSLDEKNNISYDDKGNVYAYYFFIFPNVIFNYYNWGISINIIEPISKIKTKVKYIAYVIDGYKIPKGLSSSLDKVEIEDQEVVLSVQKGVQSKYYKSGRFSPSMEKGLHHFHKLISEYFNR